jgi:hypothetical protein
MHCRSDHGTFDKQEQNGQSPGLEQILHKTDRRQQTDVHLRLSPANRTHGIAASLQTSNDHKLHGDTGSLGHEAQDNGVLLLRRALLHIHKCKRKVYGVEHEGAPDFEASGIHLQRKLQPCETNVQTASDKPQNQKLQTTHLDSALLEWRMNGLEA